MKKAIIALVAVAALPVLAACNTIEGMGKDVKAGGQAVEETAVLEQNHLGHSPARKHRHASMLGHAGIGGQCVLILAVIPHS